MNNMYLYGILYSTEMNKDNLWRSLWVNHNVQGKKRKLQCCSVQWHNHIRLFATPMGCSMPSFPVNHQFLEHVQTHVCRVRNAIQQSDVLLFPSSLALNLSQHQVFPVSQFFTSGDPSIGVSASALVLPMNIQEWFPLGWTGWISFLSKRLSRVFSNTTVQKHQFFSTQLSL